MSHEPRRRSRTASGPREAIRALSTLLLVAPALALAPERFPYIPTTILAPAVTTGQAPAAADANRVYVFREKDGSVELSSLDIGASVNAGSDFKTLSSNLPFMEGALDTTVFSPALSESGDLVVHVGDCASTSDYGIWTYSGSDSKWKQHSASLSDDTPAHPGPNSLGGSFAFSSQLEPSVSEPVLYSFGGMCPNATDTVDWQSAASYSNDMVKASLSDDATLSAVASRGPVKEAGFTLTRLQPSLSYRGETVTQQASYVMLGGHTQEAFINMSTAAVWNLPEETWSFINVNAPAGTGELRGAFASRSEEPTVDSRSGHTAVLSEDGSSLVLFGGWVGDVSRAAQPQLILLKMAGSYDEWEWVVPKEQPDGTGIYGHGAALLPGNIMMVYGGFDIEGSAWQLSRRQSFADGPQFLDLSSMKWSSSYTNPSRSSPRDDGDSGRAKRLGLGIGLGLGLPLLLAAAGLVFFCRRHARRRRTMRDDAIAALAQDRALFLPGEPDMAEPDYDGHGTLARSHPNWYTGGSDPYASGARSLGSETLRMGGHGLGLTPMHLPRKPVARQSRGAYQSVATSGIHPIAEADEETEQDRALPEPESSPPTPTSQPHSDPFANPPPAPALHSAGRASATPSPERMDPDVQGWMTDVDAAEGLLARRDRRPRGTSPAKTGRAAWDDDTRTGSNLSESARSAISTITRSTSGRSHFRGGFGLHPVTEPRLGSSSSGSASYGTGKSSFTTLQAEGPGLLHGVAADAEHYDPPVHHDEQEDDDVPGSPSKMKPRRGWLGSLRRVFTPAAEAAESPVRDSFETSRADFEPHRLSSIGGGSLLRRKKGKRGWEDGLPESTRESGVEEVRRSSGETDWDIERAVEQRLVQVMFTVPREPLRVVNAEVEGDEMSAEGRVSPARSLTGDKPARWGDVMLPELRPVSALEDPFVERGHSSSRSACGEPDAVGDTAVAPLALPRKAATSDGGRESLATDDETAVQSSPISTPSRRRTKVLDMVESIESKSRESSPKRQPNLWG